MTVEERMYAVPFGDVWRAALRALERARGLRLARADGRAGQIDAEGRSAMLRRPVRVHLQLRLDDFGLTRLEVRVEPGGGRRAARLLRAVERALREAGAPGG
jgi:hypothetical protein